MTFQGSVKYTIFKTSKVLYFNQELSSTELLRPYHVSTQLFGETWSSMTNDVRQSVTLTSTQRCDDVIKAVANYMNLAVVDIIGKLGFSVFEKADGYVAQGQL